MTALGSTRAFLPAEACIYTTARPGNTEIWGELVFRVPSAAPAVPGSVYVRPPAAAMPVESLQSEFADWQTLGLGALAQLDQYIDELPELEDEEG